ncbi:MAG: SCO family protein [Caldibacillus sp.]
MVKNRSQLGFFVVACVLLLQGCWGGRIKNAVEWPIEPFVYTDQNGKPFSLADLEGKVWVATFIFTNCKTVCPPMTANMARLQRMVAQEGLDQVEFVAFSVDPEVDTPEALREYAARYTDNTENWHFLTGYVQEHIEQFARDNFKAIVHKPEKDDQVIHGTDFYLVDQEGVIVKYYSGLDVPYEEIIGDIKILLKRG